MVELAQAEVDRNPNAGELAKEFARISPDHAEDGCHRLFQKYGFSVPLPIHKVNLGPGSLKEFPYLMFSDWVTFLLDTGRLPRLLCGVRTFADMKLTLKEFWQRYRLLQPEHEIFRMDVDFSMLVPVYSHTDEGRSYKHQPLWVLSTHGCIGRGTSTYIASKQNLKRIEERPMGLNFVGSTWSTQFMFASVLRAVLTEHPEAMDKLIGIYADDMSRLVHDGAWSSDGGLHVRILHLGTKGDFEK